MLRLEKWILGIAVLPATCFINGVQASPAKRAPAPAKTEASQPASAPTVAPEAAPARKDQAGETTLASGTKITLELAEELKSGEAKVGQQVHYFVRGDVMDEQRHILIKDGASAYGTVTKSKSHGHFGKKGKLEFTVDYVEAVDGSHVSLCANIDPKVKSSTAKVVAVTILVSPLGLFMKGKNVIAKQGTFIDAYSDSSTTIKWVPKTPKPIPATPKPQPMNDKNTSKGK